MTESSDRGLKLTISFSPLPPQYMEEGGFQNDVRMTYCASVISSIIARWEFDVPAARRFVMRCKVSSPSLLQQWVSELSWQTWEGGYASRPGVIEAQGVSYSPKDETYVRSWS